MLFFFDHIQFTPENSNQTRAAPVEAKVFETIIKNDIPFLQQQNIIDYSFLMRIVPKLWLEANATDDRKFWYHPWEKEDVFEGTDEVTGPMLNNAVKKGQAFL